MQTSYNGIPVPANGKAIEYANGVYTVPDHPIIPFIEGDGTGRDIWRASQRVFDAAVEKAYGGKRSVEWYEVLAGEKSYRKNGEWLPDDTVKATVDFRVSIKGPLTTPVGGGIRSLNVALRQLMDLYQCIRPVKYYAGVPSPVKHPEKLNVVIFRENTEDIYAGIEFREGTRGGGEADCIRQRRDAEGNEEAGAAGLGRGDQADLDYRVEAAGAGGDPVCAEGRAQDGDAGA